MKRISTTKTPVTTKKQADDAPKLTQAHFKHAKYRVGGQAVTRSAWQSAVRARLGKQRISIMLDAPIIDHFKAAAGERGYQTLINDMLRRAVEGEHIVADLRAVIREELRAANKAK
jgi:uncharacterized protein (DUF4415 family)